MCRTCGRRHNSYEMDPSSSGHQDVSLEPAGSIPFSFGIRSPGKSSPLRGRNMKDYEEQLEKLKKENFDLKLRIYLLEEHISHKGGFKDDKDLHKANIELKVETEALKKQLCDKQELLRQAAGLLDNLEYQYNQKLQAIQDTHERETQNLRATINTLEKDLQDYAENTQQEGGDNLSQLCDLAFNNMGEYPEENLIELKKPIKSNTLMPSNRMQGVFSMQKPVEYDLEERFRHAKNHSLNEGPEVIPESAKNKIQELEVEVEKLTTKVKDLQEALQEKERTSKALEEDIVNLKKEIEDRDEKVSDLEFEVTEKDQKVDQLMQELETRHLEIKAQNTTIQTLHDDLNKVEPQIEVKVQEIIEKDRIIEEKTEQLQQQNKILVEIQITLDEKQKQISELEESLTTTKQKMEKLNHDFEFSLRTIKEMASQLRTRDKEIDQLKKEVKRKEKQVKDLYAELKEALDMMKKAKWEAETCGSQDSVKDMVEEENERLWAELEQQKLEIRQLREQKETLMKEMNAKEVLLQKEKQELEEKLKSLQNEIAKWESEKNNDQVDHLKELIASRESLLKSQEAIIESLKTELAKAKEELVERKEEIKELKKELCKRGNDMHEFFTKELFGKNQALGELQSKLLSMPVNRDNPLEALRLLLEANPINMTVKPSDDKESPNHCQVRSSSLPKISETVTRNVEKEKSPSQQSPKAGRSNSFSLLENLLYANMGQKVYNTNQTFNTYVLSGETENNESEVIPMKDGSHGLSSDEKMGEMKVHKDFENKTVFPDLLHKEVVDIQGKNTSLKRKKITTPINENTEMGAGHGEESQATSESALEVLYEEVNNIRNEAQALKRDREILTEKVSALQTLNEQHIANGSSLECVKAPKLESQSSQTEEIEVSHEVIQLCSDQINKLKIEFNETKQKIPLQMLQMASSKYQDSLKNYKEEIISLRKRLADSHNACNLLRNRLEELLDFFEEILDMDKSGIIHLKHLSDMQKSSLRKSLSDSRSLSHSLSHSLMIGMDSVLNDTVATQNDAEASRFCLPTDTFGEEFELSHHVDITLPNDLINYSELSEPEPTKDFIYYAFAAKIHSHIDDKNKELESLDLKLNELFSALKSKDEDIVAKSLRIITLENQIEKLKEEISLKNQLSLQSHTSGSSGTVVEQKYSSFDAKSNSSLHLSALDHSALSPELESKIANEIFIIPQRESSCSDVLPPPQSYISSSDDHAALYSGKRLSIVSDSQVKTRSTSQSDIASLYSTDVVFKNLSHYDKESQDLKNSFSAHQLLSESRTNLEQPPLPPSFALASPSESEAWSEPDRNVSLARIGLETCNIVSASHDRSISRSRMTRSAPFTSESEGEANSEEVKEGSVGLGTAVTKSKRRSDASEIKRLTNKLKSLEQINETMKEELHIYHQTLYQQNPSVSNVKHKQVSISSLDISGTEKSFKNDGLSLIELQQNDEETSCGPSIPSSLLMEIRSLRMKLEEAITKNDLLRDQLEAALSGYLSEETKTLNIRLISLQQELECNQEKLVISLNTEQQLRLLVKQNESKTFEIGERLAEYITMNQKLERDIYELTKDLHNSKEKLCKTEKELDDTRMKIEKRTGSPKELSDSQYKQMETNINSLKTELKMLQQSEKEKELKVEQQRKYILDLEDANKDYESKLLEQESSIKELCQSITLLQHETNKSSVTDHLVTKLKDALQNRETHILEITKERFALLGEKARLQAQLASVTTHANLLQKEVRELSVSDDSTGSDSGNKGIVQKLQTAQSTIKELLRCKNLWLSEKQALQKEIHITQEEVSALRSHLDHLISREQASDLKNTSDTVSLQLSFNNLKERFVSLENTHKNMLSENNEMERKIKEAENKEKEFKATMKEQEMKREDVLSQLYAERCLTKNLQAQIKKLQLNSTNLIVPSDYECGITSVDNARPGSKASPKSKVGKGNLSVWEKSLPTDWTLNEDKENRLPRYTNLSRGTHSLPIIDDDTTSGDSPDLGIGSDGQFSSLERLSITRGQRAEQNKGLFQFGDPEKESLIRRLCTEPSHRQLLSDIQKIREEKDQINSELTSTKESLKDALTQLTNVNKRKESIEKAMVKQLSKTYDVLQKTKGNLARAKPSRNPAKQNLSTNQNEEKPQTG